MDHDDIAIIGIGIDGIDDDGLPPPPAPPRLEREGLYVGTDPNNNIVTLVPGRYIVRSPRGEEIDWAEAGSDKALMIVSSVR